jgi:hypothetical protein
MAKHPNKPSNVKVRHYKIFDTHLMMRGFIRKRSEVAQFVFTMGAIHIIVDRNRKLQQASVTLKGRGAQNQFGNTPSEKIGTNMGFKVALEAIDKTIEELRDARAS